MAIAKKTKYRMEPKPIASNASVGHSYLVDEVKTELIRKNIHFLIALTPTLAAFDRFATMISLACGIAVYSLVEAMRLSGRNVAFFSTVTALAARKRDQGRFVLGPVTLGLGALLALTFYPNPASAIAIYSLAFGDGFASLIGKMFGRVKIPFTGGKSVEGSGACFIAVLCSAYSISGKLLPSVFIALAATIIEALPLKDFDNVVIPAAVGYLAYILL
jgi:phytol kinase